MQQIADWLKKLGMSEYAERFAANRIDLSVLPDLTDQDLEKLGVFLGDRRKMLRAIVNLEASEKSAPAVPAMVNTAPPTPVVSMPISAAAPPPISAVAEATGERRYLTSDTPHTWVEWSCSQLLQNTPLHPVAEWGRQRFGGADVPAEQRLAELESSLAQVKLDPAENASLLAPLLDIPLPKERTLALAPEELRRRQLAALTNWVMAGAKVQPVVLAFEDLHWADPTTLDVLRGIAERGALAPLYIVATTRPEFRPPWGMRSHHGTISLAPLDRAQVRDMVAELSARHALPRDVVEDVAARTGGVPLFVEEVTRLLLDRGAQGGGIEAIPPTLQQSLMARLDRLGPAREVAQIGSVIGRDFSYGLLRALAEMEEAPLQSALERLADADILLVQGPTARSRLPLQARAHSGCGLREFAQEPAPSSAPSRCRDSARPIRSPRCGRTGVTGSSLHPGGHARGGNRMVGQSRSAVVGAVGAG